MKKISILGSTGSIGINALNVIDNLAGQFDVVALSANKNGKRLVKQAKKYHPDSVAIIDTNEATYVESALKNLNISMPCSSTSHVVLFMTDQLSINIGIFFS